MLRATILAITVMLAIAGGHAGAQSGILPHDDAFQLQVASQSAGIIQINWHIADGYYLYRSRLSAAIVGQDAALKLDLPKGTQKDDPIFGSSEIYRSEARLKIAVPDGAQVRISYQGCKENSVCYAPITKLVDVSSLAISDAVMPGTNEAGKQSETTDAGSTFHLSNGTYSGLVNSLLDAGGPIWVVASFWFFGLLLAFTPCLLPMYPILAATLARSGEQLTAKRGFILSSVYVFAMASAFGLLGVVAAWSGQNLQILLQSPYVVTITALIFVLLATSMFGVWELQLPSRWINLVAGVQQGQRGSIISAGFLGFTSALIVGPCVTAPLAAALLYIAQTGNVQLGAASLFALGIGQGIPLIGFGMLGGRILPPSGAWMNHLKHGFGLVFLAAATWLTSRILPPSILMALWAILFVGAGIFIGAFDLINGDGTRAQRLKKAAGCVTLLYGVMLGIGAASGASDPLRPFERFTAAPLTPAFEPLSFNRVSSLAELRQELESASSDGTPSIVYFTADWCVTCKVVEKDVLSQATVTNALNGFRRIKVDLTRSDETTRALLRELEVIGPPTIAFFNSGLSEIPDTRLVGEISAQSLITSAQRRNR